MKRIFPVLLLIVVVGAGSWFFFFSKTGPNVTTTGTSQPVKESGAKGPASGGPEGVVANTDKSADPLSSVTGEVEQKDLDVDGEVKPATDVYKSDKEALEAVKKASLDYDDLVLEQFTNVGEECGWCDNFYGSVKELIKAPDLTEDQQSYYAELLAVSGRVPNISFLVDNIKSAPSPEKAQVFLEALEMTVGGDEVVRYLGDQLSTDNESLRESVVAAVTNQDSRLAAETIYNHTVEKGDPDGYYSVGIGLGEFVPNEESLPYFNELVLKRDKFSHLAVKALLNEGINGLRMVFDSLTNSKDPDFDRQMLKDAVDHVVYEEEVEKFLKQTLESSNQALVKDFAKEILQDFEGELKEDGGE